jgi:acyl carrier protein
MMSTHTAKPEYVSPCRADVLTQIKEIVAPYASMTPDQILEEHTLIEDLGLDSLDIMEVTMEVEEQYDISVPDERVEDLRTVGDVADRVTSLLTNSASKP